MPFLRNLRDLKGIRWGKTYLWSIRIDDAPNPFNNFVPARDITIPSRSVESYSFAAYMSEYSIPHKEQAKPVINVTFLDDEDLTMKRFIEEWIEEIFPDEEYVATLETAVKTLYVQRLDSQREVIEQRAYTVYPVGQVNETLTSDSSLNTFEMGFQIVGQLEV